MKETVKLLVAFMIFLEVISFSKNINETEKIENNKIV